MNIRQILIHSFGTIKAACKAGSVSAHIIRDRDSKAGALGAFGRNRNRAAVPHDPRRRHNEQRRSDTLRALAAGQQN